MNRISELRKKLGLTQTRLGEEIGVSQQTISKYEKVDENISGDMLLALSKFFKVPVDYILRKDEEEQQREQVAQTQHGIQGKNVIAIGRQFGSGGHDIGKALAEKLGYDFYDAEIIQMAAGTTGYTPEFIKKNEEIMTNSLLYDLVNQMYLNSNSQDEAPKDKIFAAESKVVRELAEKGNCVIVGRCADYVLRNSENCLKVFFSAPLESRIKRVSKRQNISEKEANTVVQKNEKLRADNYRYYTRRMWGAAGNFDLSLNTDLGEDYIEICIRGAMKL